MRRAAILGLNFLLVLALVAGCGDGPALEPPAETAPRLNPALELPATLAAWPTLSGRHPDVPDDYALVAASENLQLYLNQTTSALIVEDKRNGQLWRSSPADLDDAKVSQAWRNRIASPVLLGYTDPDRGRAKVSKPEEMEMVFVPVEGGVRADYRFPEDGFALSVLYVVRDDFLEVTVPEDSVVEADVNTLISLDVLLFFGATHDGQEGYIVFPDGSGTLMTYTSPHPEAVQEISASIYGPDEIDVEEDAPFQYPASMPVFGLVSGQAAFVGLITQGDFDANVSVGRSGKAIPYNHTWVTFIYRRQGEFSLTGGQPAWLYEPNLAGGDRQVRYYFLTGEEANYVGMATRYRDFLVRERGAGRIPDDAPLMGLDFFMGVERRTWFLGELIAMTTFADVQEILADLHAAGVSRVDVTLDAWNQGAIEERYPQRLPVEERLGGEAGLHALAGDVHVRQQRLFLTDWYDVALPRGRGVFGFSDAVRGVDGLPVGGGGFYFLNPQVSMRKFAVHDIPQMVELGGDGLRLDGLAYLAVPDTNDRYPLSRESYAASWMQLADLTREEFGVVAMTGGNTYAVSHADRLDWVPMDSTHYDLFDGTIPFYQIAVHGLVSYSGQPYNLHNDGQRTFLQQIEYGAIPHFVLTKENSAQLYRTFANQIWSTRYDFWRDEVIRQYQTMEKLAPLLSQFIVGHARLAKDVYQTTYEDGTRVVVNYGGQPYVLGSVTVPALDFVVLQGVGGAK